MLFSGEPSKGLRGNLAACLLAVCFAVSSLYTTAAVAVSPYCPGYAPPGPPPTPPNPPGPGPGPVPGPYSPPEPLPSNYMWCPGTAMPAGAFDAGAAVYGNKIYLVGGHTNAGATAAVHYAQISAADGTLGAWQATTALPVPASGLRVTAHGGHLYAVGGIVGGGISNQVYYAPISTDGTLGAWQQTAALKDARAYFGMARFGDLGGAALGGRIYVAGGAADGNFGALSSVEYTKIKSDGSLAPWQYAEFALPQKVRGLSMVAVDAGLVTAGGFACDGSFACQNSGEGGQILSTVRYAAFEASGTMHNWTTQNSMATARQNFGLVHYNGNIFALGGMGKATDTLATVEAAGFATPTTLTRWGPQAPLNAARMKFASVPFARAPAVPVIYILGGGTSFGGPTASVEFFTEE